MRLAISGQNDDTFTRPLPQTTIKLVAVEKNKLPLPEIETLVSSFEKVGLEQDESVYELPNTLPISDEATNLDQPNIHVWSKELEETISQEKLKMQRFAKMQRKVLASGNEGANGQQTSRSNTKKRVKGMKKKELSKPHDDEGQDQQNESQSVGKRIEVLDNEAKQQSNVIDSNIESGEKAQELEISNAPAPENLNPEDVKVEDKEANDNTEHMVQEDSNVQEDVDQLPPAAQMITERQESFTAGTPHFKIESQQEDPSNKVADQK